ncbi:4a-hydroxytetrahydrobiopterin dehydratase [Nocardia vermiculata]|uniref:Putative pterin-4-alpha-carbinolamine dehydratase n=1 Tax=Nocardia vermiculata TaxID=257274 RepID=A0A846XXS6_9NOCA|nr:4a-hydroxytetrahydrobiopterin dehydratase [Nocardia vermiculata]NKY49019.1 4a-hydroxytetrahydrobiopterin dehydratase [Nocardia vermiculata]
MSTPLLSDNEIAAGLRELPDWTRTGASISRTVEAPTFLAGIDLVRRVADSAERVDHHPDIDIRWRRVTFTLSTHSEGGLTRKDLALAGQIDRLAAQS